MSEWQDNHTTFRAEHFMGPMLDVLRELVALGEIISKRDIEERMLLNLPEYRRQRPWITGSQTESDIRLQRLNWAANYLQEHGCLERPRRGWLLLTQKGWETRLTDEDSFRIAKEVEKRRRDRQGARPPKPNAAEEKLVGAEDRMEEKIDAGFLRSSPGTERSELTTLTPAQFEHQCKDLLERIGVTHLRVTGRSGDGGIDGVGILVSNHIEQKRVAFQCKKYTGPVGPSHVRDFRGATAGRADIRVLITTARFTAEAQHEAVRDGADRISLIDGDKLWELLSKNGSKPDV
jgi:restriction system protein